MESSIGNRLIESEIRAYNNRLKRYRIVKRQRILLALVLGMITAIAVILATSIVLNAQADDRQTLFKYYTQVEVHPDDTLWDYAKKYALPSKYKDKESYISEVRAINHFADDYCVKAGELIVIPYYCTEYK
ncbi:MAG: hypothetical protein K6E91_00935 [Butyrivibrio sp.]|nr:hypothetical protein [Butyrivibrio sp.]